MLIKQPSEITSKSVVAALIYGQSGMGKTTLACSAPNPVLFDFDGGADRLSDEHQVPTVQVTSYSEALQALDEVKAGGYQSVIVDTASKLIDSIIYDVCGVAVPKLNQYGILNQKFKTFNRSVTALGINVVYVCQREVEKDGETTRYIPQFRASNYKDVICDLDICGYMEMINVRGKSQRVITFDPTPRSEGKNTGGFEPSYVIPTLKTGDPNIFLAQIFRQYQQRQSEKNARRQKLAQEVAQKFEAFDAELATCTDATSFNQLFDIYLHTANVGDLRARMRQAIIAMAAKLNLKYSKEENRYE